MCARRPGPADADAAVAAAAAHRQSMASVRWRGGPRLHSFALRAPTARSPCVTIHCVSWWWATVRPRGPVSGLGARERGPGQARTDARLPWPRAPTAGVGKSSLIHSVLNDEFSKDVRSQTAERRRAASSRPRPHAARALAQVASVLPESQVRGEPMLEDKTLVIVDTPGTS